MSRWIQWAPDQACPSVQKIGMGIISVFQKIVTFIRRIHTHVLNIPRIIQKIHFKKKSGALMCQRHSLWASSVFGVLSTLFAETTPPTEMFWIASSHSLGSGKPYQKRAQWGSMKASTLGRLLNKVRQKCRIVQMEDFLSTNIQYFIHCLHRRK
jgi:hypothetical protein